MKRVPIRRRSAKRRAAAPLRREVWEQILNRDRTCRLAGLPGVGPCYGRLTPHHLLKASAGGMFTPANLVVACVAHNDWVEDHPTEAHALGMVTRPTS